MIIHLLMRIAHFDFSVPGTFLLSWHFSFVLAEEQPGRSCANAVTEVKSWPTQMSPCFTSEFDSNAKKLTSPILRRSAVEFLPLMFATIANLGHIAR
jgi:hypothetical protein